MRLNDRQRAYLRKSTHRVNAVIVRKLLDDLEESEGYRRAMQARLYGPRHGTLVVRIECEENIDAAFGNVVDAVMFLQSAGGIP